MTDREAFEQLLADRGRSISSYTDSRGVTEYADDAVQEGWEVWQTALAYARPEGYRLVPVAPTVEMINAGMRPGIGFYETGEITEEMAEGCYRAMITAAPSGKEGV